jgi:EPS-associated MarR family transcriptional regulator
MPHISDIHYEESHLKVLRLLQINPGLSQRDLSQALGVSLGKINYCMRALLDRGLIKMQSFRGSGNKQGYSYLLTAEGVVVKSELAHKLLQIKVREYKELCHEIEELKKEIEK